MPRVIKGFLFLCIIVSFFITGSLLKLFPIGSNKRLSSSTRLTSFFCKQVLGILGIRVSSNLESLSFPVDKNFLILSNHLSYLDVFILSSLLPSVFIASVDQAQSNLILGKATELSGSLFIERRSRSNIREELQSISGTFQMGANLVLFPEGTTSNGEKVLPFKSSFLALAENADIEILPVSIKYTKINEQYVSPQNRDIIYYYGDMTFFTHFFKLLSVSSVDVELRFLDIIHSEDIDCRKELASFSYSTISSAYSNY